MRLVLHAGAHCTDDNKILACLAQNQPDAIKRGVAVPRPITYRRQIRDALHELRQGVLEDSTRFALLDGMLEGKSADRMVLSNAKFFGVPKLAMSGGQFYPGAADRLFYFCDLFAGHDVELFFALRDPASFVPALIADTAPDVAATMLSECQPHALRWSEMIYRIQGVLPGMPITLWCNEDTPMIWEEILREMLGYGPLDPIRGAHDLLKDIMSPEGFRRFTTYIHDHAGMTEVQKRRVIAAFLDKFAVEDALEEEYDLPGWSAELMDSMTEAFEEDVYELERMPGVRFISP